jgi:hypothetical protein
MANLLGQNIGTNYKGILNLDTINTPLDATLRAVTDGEGNASPLQLSTDAVSVGAISGARLGIKGSGSTSATTSLLVQNSAGTSALTIKDNLSATFGGALTSSSNITTTATLQGGNINAVNILYIGNYQSSLKSNGSGIIQLQNTAENDFSRLQFGGTTSSFPSLKRNGTAIDVRLADDSNYALLNTGATFIKGSGTTASTTALLVENSAGTQSFKVADGGSVQIGSTSGINWTFNSNILSSNQYAYIAGSNGSILTNGSFSGGVHGNGNGGKVCDNDISTAQVASAVLEVSSTTKGFLPPRMTTTQKNAIATPASGLIVYDSTTNKLACYNGTTWNDLF